MRVFLALITTALMTVSAATMADASPNDGVSFALTHADQSISTSGGDVTFEATVNAPTSNSAAVFLNGDSFNVTAPVTLNDNDFFSDFPAFLSPNSSFTGQLFVLTAPSNIAPGTYDGTFFLLGGAEVDDANVIGTVDFSLTVPSPTVATSESSSLALLGTGLVGLMVVMRRRFRLAATQSA